MTSKQEGTDYFMFADDLDIEGALRGHEISIGSMDLPL